MKRVAIIGSTGSIGQSTLDVIRHLQGEFQVVGLAAGSQVDALQAQATEFGVPVVALYDDVAAAELQRRLPDTEVLSGMEGVAAVAAESGADFVVSAMTGTLGLIPTMAAINAGCTVGLANKEALVSGGSLVMESAKLRGVRILPIDSEHSAIFQCLNGEDRAEVNRLILTSSGGPFRRFSEEQLQHVTVDEALAHPTWRMGPKVTIDSSTLMNKGLEVIEAHFLFDVPLDGIDVVVHPQSIIHSMVEFVDGSLMAQMGEPTMVTPIQYALTWPKRRPGRLPPFDFSRHGCLEFFPPNRSLFRCLDIAYGAARQGGSAPCYMNAANEVLVQRFLKRSIGWHAISERLDRLMQSYKSFNISSLDDILEVDAKARREALAI